MKIKLTFLALMLTILGGVASAQKAFKDQYKSFYELINNQTYYQMNASVVIFKQNSKTLEMDFGVKKKENDFFMSMGETERIYNQNMVITMNKGMKSIILSEREKDEYNLFSTSEYFALLDSISDLTNIQLLESNGTISKYEIKLEKNVYKSLELTFDGNLLTKMTVYYSDSKAPYDKAELTMSFMFSEMLSEDYFSMNRYTHLGKNGYELRPEFKDFELSLN